jgi:hypothetical protein
MTYEFDILFQFLHTLSLTYAVWEATKWQNSISVPISCASAGGTTYSGGTLCSFADLELLFQGDAWDSVRCAVLSSQR